MTGVRRVEQHPAGLVFNQRGLLSSPHPHHHHATHSWCVLALDSCTGSSPSWELSSTLKVRKGASKKSEHLPEMSQLQRAELGSFPGHPSSG